MSTKVFVGNTTDGKSLVILFGIGHDLSRFFLGLDCLSNQYRAMVNLGHFLLHCLWANTTYIYIDVYVPNKTMSSDPETLSKMHIVGLIPLTIQMLIL